MKAISDFQLYGTLPAFDCLKCKNAISSRTCSICGNRLTKEDIEKLFNMTEAEKAYFNDRLK